MKLFEEITAQDMLDYLHKLVVKEMKRGEVAKASKVTVLMTMIEETAKETAKEKGLDR